jgi:uncharacterized protein (DUF4415 family)
VTLEEALALPDETDYARLAATTDEDIARQIAEDDEASPEFTDDMLAEGYWVVPPRKTPISFRVDTDVLSWFKATSPRYQTRMNAVLRAYMRHQQQKAAESSGTRPHGRGATAAGKRGGKR